MKKLLKLILLISILSYACNTNMKEDSMEKWKREIVDTEKEFAEMALKEGIPKAFLTYAAEDVVLMRNNSLIIGKESLQESYKNKESESGNVSLSWKPDFVDVASSGDLGYTYGKYVYTTTDSIGNAKVVEGIFHTVWKRQSDGKWRFVWD
jgi:ketosteroid isomerase-like protein